MEPREIIHAYLKRVDLYASGVSQKDDFFYELEKKFTLIVKKYCEEQKLTQAYRTLLQMGVEEQVVRQAGIMDHSPQKMEEDFIAAGKQYAEKQRITYDELVAKNIPENVLHKAGIYRDTHSNY